MCSTLTPTFPDYNVLSNNPHNNLFLPGFSSSPGWLLVTRTRGAWWCRYRGHWRSGALDIFLHGPESAHKNGILKSFTHTSIPIQPRTLLKKREKKRRRKKLNSPNMMPSFSCPLLSIVVVGDGQKAWQMLLRTTPRRRLRLGQYWQKTFVDMFNTYANISRQQCPF